ncbi:uncharacterized protein LOC100842902 [Brachypodium distachyon]|uniref:N-acetyltransferase domain-containing protein n=1 Tax=Brachypodium distachyon TaxID=15368 RepID=A0A0Q3GP04_BRADI|nr:uncharacterized protein LOC100842902 [Brachypodium distachyon]KQK12767.2 hypothetical protein BRADI_1g05813v3 [Brachypodium distachyon]|eukprot:XP_003559324.1 uncharacterized protein LOC100842902 [Brachypodium distachyon]
MEVTLRRFDLSDVDAMMSWASDPEVAAFCRWEPYSSTESLLAYLRDTVLPHPWYRAICVGSGAGNDRPVGLVSLAPSPEERCRGELGYLVARAHWGKGVATAAVKRALGVVFGEVEELARVEALVDVDNAASQRVAEKAGFRREGVLRRHYWHKGRARDLVMYSFISNGARAEEGSEMEERGAPAVSLPGRGEKVVALRPFDLGDFDAELTWASDPVAAAPMPRAWDPCPSRESLLAFLWLWDSPLRRPWVRAICIGPGAGVAGAVAVTRTDDRCRAEIGVVLARAHSSVTVAAAAMRRAVAAFFGDGGLEGVERVEAVVDAGGGDGAPRRALEEAGFRREAVLRSYRAVEGQPRDMAIYSFISTDPLLD